MSAIVRLFPLLIKQLFPLLICLLSFGKPSGVFAQIGGSSLLNRATAASTNTLPGSNSGTLSVYAQLNLTFFLQGFYTGNRQMFATLYNLGLSSDPTACDFINVSLWSPDHLGNVSADFTYAGILHSNGKVTLDFPATAIGHLYYIAIKHRNSIETWSHDPILFNFVINYDFSTALSQAYDDGLHPPMAYVETGVFALYCGDINQDGVIESSDYSEMENAVYVSSTGYTVDDITGDAVVESSDYSMMENNVYLTISVARPF